MIETILSQLYQKYIKTGCDYEINISFDEKNKFDNLMKNKENWLKTNKLSVDELFILFDGCIWEMVKLMNDSFKRFTSTKEFNKIKTNI